MFFSFKKEKNEKKILRETLFRLSEFVQQLIKKHKQSAALRQKFLLILFFSKKRMNNRKGDSDGQTAAA